MLFPQPSRAMRSAYSFDRFIPRRLSIDSDISNFKLTTSDDDDEGAYAYTNYFLFLDFFVA